MTLAFLCIATAIYFEARDQPDIGQAAVGHVIVNRIEDRRFPNDACSVVKQGPTYSWTENFPVRHRCQFSFYCDGKPDRPNVNGAAWQRAVAATNAALTEKDPTEGATHYHATYVLPAWAASKTRTVRIDDHIFYRWEK